MREGMSLSTSLASSLGSPTTIFSQSVETNSLKSCTGCPLHAVPYVQRLPTDLMLRIFMEVTESLNYDLMWIGVLSSVCRRWHRICQHTVMWKFVAKHVFVAYPLVQRLRCAPFGNSDRKLLSLMRLSGAPEEFIAQDGAMMSVIAPTSQTLRCAMDSVKRYRDHRIYHEFVQRRRVFVLHMFLSWSLLSFSLFLGTTACAAEGIAFGDVCTTGTSVSLLCLTYLAVNSSVIANVVMTTRFEHKPLLCRFRNNKPLIVDSSVTMVVGIVDIAILILLVQLNYSHARQFSWLWCSTASILSLCLWQLYVILSCIASDAQQQLHQQRTGVQLKGMAMFLMLTVPNIFPFLFSGTILCVLHHVEYGSRMHILIGTIPVTASLSVLALLFLFDYCRMRRTKDLITVICLVFAGIFPLSLMWTHFRGLTLFPVSVASFMFFCAHMRIVVMGAFKELVEGVQSSHRVHGLT